jgi:SGF29 tudor-like domain
LPESQVVVLQPIEKLRVGDTVYAVYPDTTSFYQATVVQVPPRKQSGAPGAFVMVTFVDDSDDFGITHDKAIPLKHIMLPP